MKIEDMILATIRDGKKETNMILTMEGYAREFISGDCVFPSEIAEHMEGLLKTRSGEQDWVKVRYPSFMESQARFCTSEGVLLGFLLGHFNEKGSKWKLDEEKCSPECMDKLQSLGICTNGTHNLAFKETYELLESSFSQGDILHNFNGSDYRVMERLSARNLLLMDMKQGNFVVGIGTSLYSRHEKGVELTEDNQTIAVSWDHGVYLGSTPSEIDFEELRERYGEERSITTLSEYRSERNREFHFLQKIIGNKHMTEGMKELAQEQLYSEFMTAKRDTFMENLNDGKYDAGFLGRSEVKKAQVR